MTLKRSVLRKRESMNITTLPESAMSHVAVETQTLLSRAITVIISVLLTVMVLLKIMKYAIKWQRNKLNTIDAITQTNILLSELLTELSASTALSRN